MDAYIIGEHMLMADSLVTPNNRDVCRKATSLDFSKLEGAWIPHEEYNKYMDALRKKVGDFGPNLIGKQIPKVVDKIFGMFSAVDTVYEAFEVMAKGYKDNNKGTDAGEYTVEKVEPGFARIVTMSPLDEGFHLGVGEGLIRFYIGMVTRAEAVETMEKNGRAVFEYEWKDLRRFRKDNF